MSNYQIPYDARLTTSETIWTVQQIRPAFKCDHRIDTPISAIAASFQRTRHSTHTTRQCCDVQRKIRSEDHVTIDSIDYRPEIVFRYVIIPQVLRFRRWWADLRSFLFVRQYFCVVLIRAHVPLFALARLLWCVLIQEKVATKWQRLYSQLCGNKKLAIERAGYFRIFLLLNADLVLCIDNFERFRLSD